MSKPMQKHMVNSLTRVDPRWHVKIGFIFSNFFIGQASSVEFLETIIKLVSNQKGPSKVDVMPEGNLEAAWRQLGGSLEADSQKNKNGFSRAKAVTYNTPIIKSNHPSCPITLSLKFYHRDYDRVGTFFFKTRQNGHQWFLGHLKYS